MDNKFCPAPIEIQNKAHHANSLIEADANVVKFYQVDTSVQQYIQCRRFLEVESGSQKVDKQQYETEGQLFLAFCFLFAFDGLIDLAKIFSTRKHIS